MTNSSRVYKKNSFKIKLIHASEEILPDKIFIKEISSRVTHRPTFEELNNELSKYYFESNKESTNTTTTTTTTPLNYQTHPQAIYTSRLLNFSKFPKPKNEENFRRKLEELTKSMSLVKLNTDPSNKIITKSNIPAQIFEIILKGINDTENMDTITMYDLMVVANELEFEELSEKLENHLIQSKASWLRTHFTFIYHVIFKHNKFKNLKNFCNNIIVKQPRIIFESAEFSSLYESALVSILKCDDLQINEKEIWDYVIKWGTAQNPTLPEKMEEWSDENIMTLKTFITSKIHYPSTKVSFKRNTSKKNMDTITMYDLMVVANELEFEELSEKLENHLIQSKASWLRTHFTFIYHVIFKHNKFKNLKNFCNNIIVKQPRIIFESAEFSSLYESALVSILKCDDLQINEKEIWDYVIKWGTAQNPTLPEKMEEWSDENIMTLKTFVIFTFQIQISPVKSIILPQRLALKEILAKVIEFYSLTNNPYVSQLLIRGSKDGFAPRTFWNICNRHNNIGIVEVERTNEIIGGFNPLAWNKTKEGLIKTNKSFIFSFKGDDYDPTFGEYEFMMRSDVSDFTQDKKNQCYCYDRFSIIDYEVFKVVKKSF
ncbi:hypothetical protein Glove_130g21 [Diversispora epigaea]|uniref:TLDc domain-containing protein n=1 Tax=Diversispora epigaea TaxID=1348612 RepID=A0A397J8A4_9GLOM|nr:hypothetical protein Glove_130g21 [Diversispora epigaea]